jgi:hypothetical protein
MRRSCEQTQCVLCLQAEAHVAGASAWALAQAASKRAEPEAGAAVADSTAMQPWPLLQFVTSVRDVVLLPGDRRTGGVLDDLASHERLHLLVDHRPTAAPAQLQSCSAEEALGQALYVCPPGSRGHETGSTSEVASKDETPKVFVFPLQLWREGNSQALLKLQSLLQSDKKKVCIRGACQQPLCGGHPCMCRQREVDIFTKILVLTFILLLGHGKFTSHGFTHTGTRSASQDRHDSIGGDRPRCMRRMRELREGRVPLETPPNVPPSQALRSMPCG